MGEVIAMLSGSGGLGKTALTAGLALELARSEKKVLCVDCQEGLGTLDIFLCMEQMDVLSYVDICRGDYPLEQAAQHPQFHTLHFLSAPIRVMPDEPDPRIFQAIIARARNYYDFVFLNAPAGLGNMAMLTARGADRCIVLCGMDPATVRTAGRVADALQLQHKPDVRLVVSRLQPNVLKAMKTTVDDLMDQVGLSLLGLVPEDEQIPLLCSAGKFCSGKKWAFAAYARIAKRIQGQSVPVPTR